MDTRLCTTPVIITYEKPQDLRRAESDPAAVNDPARTAATGQRSAPGLPRHRSARAPVDPPRAMPAFAFNLSQVSEEIDLDGVPLGGQVALAALGDVPRYFPAEPRLWVEAGPFHATGPATHSDWASASGMIAPSGWTRPMKYSPA